jgi:adenine-specific DNA-methyltransferase
MNLYYKYRPSHEGVMATTCWTDSKYSATEHGTGIVKKLFPEYSVFSYPKSVYAVEDCISLGGMGDGGGLCLDYFAGSGTTAHAVVNLNRKDGGERKYALVEMGEYFDSVTKSRVKKVLYSDEWEFGKPVSRNGISHLAKYIRLESYEDCLDNLSLVRTSDQQRLVDEHDRVREDYMLRYMLDVEANGCLLDLSAFNDPFNYKLSVIREDERRTARVDLVETFNYLLGLRVKTRERKRGVLELVGVSPEGETLLVLWRNVDEVDNDALDDWFQKQGYNARDLEFQTIYVNGDNNIENQRRPDETWKV